MIMKTKRLIKEITLSKERISKLNNFDKSIVKGGNHPPNADNTKYGCSYVGLPC